jgi:hypothetical protein
VKEKYSSAPYNINLDGAGVVNGTTKILYKYTSTSGGQEYYNYSDVSDPDNQLNKVAVSSDGGANWYSDSEAFAGGWAMAGMPPPAGKVNNVYVATWSDVQDRLVVLATP